MSVAIQLVVCFGCILSCASDVFYQCPEPPPVFGLNVTVLSRAGCSLFQDGCDAELAVTYIPNLVCFSDLKLTVKVSGAWFDIFDVKLDGSTTKSILQSSLHNSTFWNGSELVVEMMFGNHSTPSCLTPQVTLRLRFLHRRAVGSTGSLKCDTQIDVLESDIKGLPVFKGTTFASPLLEKVGVNEDHFECEIACLEAPFKCYLHLREETVRSTIFRGRPSNDMVEIADMVIIIENQHGHIVFYTAEVRANGWVITITPSNGTTDIYLSTQYFGRQLGEVTHLSVHKDCVSISIRHPVNFLFGAVSVFSRQQTGRLSCNNLRKLVIFQDPKQTFAGLWIVPERITSDRIVENQFACGVTDLSQLDLVTFTAVVMNFGLNTIYDIKIDIRFDSEVLTVPKIDFVNVTYGNAIASIGYSFSLSADQVSVAVDYLASEESGIDGLNILLVGVTFQVADRDSLPSVGVVTATVKSFSSAVNFVTNEGEVPLGKYVIKRTVSLADLLIEVNTGTVQVHAKKQPGHDATKALEARVARADRETERHSLFVRDAFVVESAASPTVTVQNTSVPETPTLELTEGELAIIVVKFVVPEGTASIDIGLNIVSSVSNLDCLGVVNASVVDVADMTVSGVQAVAVSPNASQPKSIVWTFPTVVNPSSVDDENDTISVQAVVVAAKDVVGLKTPRVTISAFAVVDNSTVSGSSVVLKLVSPYLATTVNTSANDVATGALDVSIQIVHSNASTAVAKNLSFSLSLSPSVAVNVPDIEVVFNPSDMRNVMPKLSTTENKTLLNIDIGDLERGSTVRIDLSLLTDNITTISSDGLQITHVVVYYSIDENDKILAGFPASYPNYLNIKTMSTTARSSLCVREELSYVTEVEWTYKLAIIGGLVGFIVSVLLFLLIFCLACRNRRYISYEFLATSRSQRMTYDNENCLTACLTACCCCCCVWKRKKFRTSGQEDAVALVRHNQRARSPLLSGLKDQSLLTASTSSASANILDATTRSATARSGNTEFSLQVSGIVRSDTPLDDLSSGRGRSSAVSSRLSYAKIAWEDGSHEGNTRSDGVPIQDLEIVGSSAQARGHIEELDVERSGAAKEANASLQQSLNPDNVYANVDRSDWATVVGSKPLTDDTVDSEGSSISLPVSRPATGYDDLVPIAEEVDEPVIFEQRGPSQGLFASQTLVLPDDSVPSLEETHVPAIDNNVNSQRSASLPMSQLLSGYEGRIPINYERHIRTAEVGVGKPARDVVVNSGSPHLNLLLSRAPTAHAVVDGHSAEPLANEAVDFSHHSTTLPVTRSPIATDELFVGDNGVELEIDSVFEPLRSSSSLLVKQPNPVYGGGVPICKNGESSLDNTIDSLVYSPNLAVGRPTTGTDEPLVSNSGVQPAIGNVVEPLYSSANVLVSQPLPGHDDVVPTRNQDGKSPIVESVGRPLSSTQLHVSRPQSKPDDYASTRNDGGIAPVDGDVFDSQKFSKSVHSSRPQTMPSKKVDGAPDELDMVTSRRKTLPAIQPNSMPEGGIEKPLHRSLVGIEEVAAEPEGLNDPDKTKEVVATVPKHTSTRSGPNKKQGLRKLAVKPKNPDDSTSERNLNFPFKTDASQSYPAVSVPSERGEDALAGPMGVHVYKSVDESGKDRPVVLRKSTGTLLEFEPVDVLDSLGSTDPRQICIYPVGVEDRNSLARSGDSTPFDLQEPAETLPEREPVNRHSIPDSGVHHHVRVCPRGVDDRNSVDRSGGSTPFALQEPVETMPEEERVNSVDIPSSGEPHQPRTYPVGVDDHNPVDRRGKSSPLALQEPAETLPERELVKKIGIPGNEEAHQPPVYPRSVDARYTVDRRGRSTPFASQEPIGTLAEGDPVNRVDIPGSGEPHQGVYPGVYPVGVDDNNPVDRSGNSAPLALKEPAGTLPEREPVNRSGMPGSGQSRVYSRGIDDRNSDDSSRKGTPNPLQYSAGTMPELELLSRVGIPGVVDHNPVYQNQRSTPPFVSQQLSGTSPELEPVKIGGIPGSGEPHQSRVYPRGVDDRNANDSSRKSTPYPLQDSGGAMPELETVDRVGILGTTDVEDQSPVYRNRRSIPFVSQQPIGTSPELEPVNRVPLSVDCSNPEDETGKNTPFLLEKRRGTSPELEAEVGLEIKGTAELRQPRVALKLRKRRKSILPSPVGVVTTNTDVMLSRPFVESRAADERPSTTETIPGSVGDPVDPARDFVSSATPDISKPRTADTMRRVSSVTIPVLDSGDNSRTDSVLSWFSSKIGGLFSRSGSRAARTAPKASRRRPPTIGRTPRAWSVLGAVGKPIEETEEEDARSDTFSPDIPEECVDIPEWEVVIAWIQDEPERQQMELESLDFLASISLDAELEQNRIDLYLYLLIWFIQALRSIGKLSPAQEAKLFDRLRSLMIKLEKKLAKEKSARAKEAAQALTKKHEKRRRELDLKHYREKFNRGMKTEKTEDGIYAPCDGKAYLTGKFKIRIVQDKPDPELNEGEDIIMTNLLPWKKIDCRGLKIKRDQWIGSVIREVKGMMGHKPTQVKRRVTHHQSFDMWQSSTSRHKVGTASRVSADFHGSRGHVKQSLDSSLPSQGGSGTPDLPAVSPLVQKQQESEKDDLEDELRLERDEEAENLRKLFAAKKFMGMKDVKKKLIREASLEAGLDNDDSEQVRLLLNELADGVVYLEEAIDEERARIRACLMDRLGKREAVAETLEEHKEYCNDLEDMLSVQREEIAKKIADIEPNQLEYFAELEVELAEILDEKKEDHSRGLELLEGKLPKENSNKRSELRKRQSEELETFVKSQDTLRLKSKKNATSLVKCIDGHVTFLRKQREEREHLETILDDESKRRIIEVNEELEKSTENLLLHQSSRLADFLTSHGLLELDSTCIVQGHANDLQELKKTRKVALSERKQQIEERLEQLQCQLEESRIKELEDGKQTRNRVQLIIKKLLDAQLSLSPEDRTKFEDDQAVQLVDQENRLTINKLRQKRILRKSISDKQRQLHEKLEEKRRQETLLNLVSGAVGDKQRTDAKTWKSHKKAVTELLKSSRISFAQEMAKLEVDVAKQRASDVQKHEEVIGADLYAGKMAMEKNMLQKQKDAEAINLLQMGLSQEMAMRNDPQLDAVNEKIIKDHKQGMERLGTALAKQREKQEAALMRRLKEQIERKISRSSARESQGRQSTASLDTVHEGEQIQDEQEKSLDLQTRQAKRYAKEKAELDRLVAMEEHGLDLVSRLVRSGRFEESELLGALRSLFPTKSEKELDLILDKLYKDTARKQRGRRGTRRASKLEEIIQGDMEKLRLLASASNEIEDDK